MSSINKCIFSGRICSEVECRRTQDGTAVVNYRLAIDRRFKRDGQPSADFIPVVVWGNNAEFAAKYFRKGMRVELVARVQTRDYTTNDGRKVYVTEFVAEEQGFGEPKSDGASVFQSRMSVDDVCAPAAAVLSGVRVENAWESEGRR